MKKIVGIILAVVVLAAVGIVLFSRVRVKETGIAAENLVPEETLVYISQKEIGRDWEKLKTSNFWKELASSEWWQELAPQLQDFKGNIESSWGITLNEGDIIGLFGREVALALLPGEGESLQPRGLLLTRVKMKTKIQEHLAKLQDKLSGEGKLSSEIYKEVRITNLNTLSPDVELSYAFLGDWLVLGIGKSRSALKESIDVYRDEGRKALANNDNFQDIRVKLPEERAGLFYLNMEGALAAYPEGIIEGTSKGEPFFLTELIRQTSASLEMVKAMGMVTWFDEGLKAKLCLLLNPDKTDADLLKMYSWKPRKSESIKYIPKGTVIYASSSSFEDIGTYWKYLQATLKEQNPQVAEGVFRGVERLNTEWGLSLEDDIFSWIGNEFAYAISEVNMEGMFPLPSFFLMLKVKDEKRARQTLDKLENILEKIGLEKGVPFSLKFAGEEYEGEEIKFLQVLVLTPGYAFVNDFLIISADTSTIKKLIDTKKGKEDSLSKDANFKRVESIFRDKSNSLGYLNVEKTLGIVRSLTGLMLSAQERRVEGMAKSKAALESREFDTPEERERELADFQRRLNMKEGQVINLRENLEKIVYPLLESLKILKSLGVNAITDKEGAEQTFYLAVEEG